MRTGAVGLALALAASCCGAHSLAARQVPPEPGPVPGLVAPGIREATLSNGAGVLVVPGGEVPLVTVILALPSGTAADPPGREGTAGMVARLLDAGTTDLNGGDIRRELGILGAALSVSASPDLLRVALRTPAENLEAALDLMARVVAAPAFPEDALEAAREAVLASLEDQLSRAGALADRFYLAEAYADHPYGRSPSPASIRSLTRDDLLGWHGTLVRPAGAAFVVAGDVTPDAAVRALEAAFSVWPAGAAPPATTPRASNRANPEVVIIDRPGRVRSEVRLGHLLPRGTDPDWPALLVAARILGGGPDSRLDRRLRAESNVTADAFAVAGRQRDRGYLELGFSARPEAVAETLEQVLAEVARLRDQPVPAGELDRIRRRILGEQILELETPPQVAESLARARGLGLPSDTESLFRSRVAELTPEGLRRVVRSHVRPGEVVIVAVGDAGALRPQLEPFGPVRVLNVRGLGREGVASEDQQASEDFSGVGLEPLTAEYTVYFQGREVGSTTRTLEVLADSLLRFRTRASLGGREVEQSVTVRARDLGFISSEIRVRAMGRELGGTLRREGDRITGSLSSPEGDNPVDVAAGDDVMVADMLELAVWVSELEVGKVISVPVLNIESGRVETVRLRVVDRIDDLIVAGEALEAVFEVQVDASDPQTLFARVEAPHVVLVLKPATQPVDVVLTSLTPGVEDPGAGSGAGSGQGGGGAPEGGDGGR